MFLLGEFQSISIIFSSEIIQKLSIIWNDHERISSGLQLLVHNEELFYLVPYSLWKNPHVFKLRCLVHSKKLDRRYIKTDENLF